MTVKEELYQLIDQLAEEDAAAALDHLRWLAAGHDTLTAEKLAGVPAGEEEIRQGRFTTLTDLRRSLGA